MNNLPKRKNNRLLGFNYSNSASYFITICTANRRKLFWTDKLDGVLSDQGIVAEQELLALPKRFMLTGIDKYVIMPDHIHLIITLIGAMPGTDEKTPDVKMLSEASRQKLQDESETEIPFGRNRSMTMLSEIIKNTRIFGNTLNSIHVNIWNPGNIKNFLFKQKNLTIQTGGHARPYNRNRR